MSHVALKCLVGTALVEREFCEGLLNGECPALLTDKGLSDEERELVLSIEANSIAEFVGQLCEGLKSEGSSISSLSTRAVAA